MQLTNKLHRLAQRLQIDYHTLIQYLSQDCVAYEVFNARVLQYKKNF